MINIFLLHDISKGIALTSLKVPGQLTCLAKSSGRPDISNLLMSPVHFEAGIQTGKLVLSGKKAKIINSLLRMKWSFICKDLISFTQGCLVRRLIGFDQVV